MKAEAVAEAEAEAVADAHAEAEAEASALKPSHLRAARIGHGANCSSVGSVVDTLFLSAALGGAMFAALCAAMQSEPVRVVGAKEKDDTKSDEDDA